MKKILAILLVFVMLLSMTACAKNEEQPEKTPETTVSNTPADTGAAAAGTDKPYDGVTITVLGNSSEISTFMQSHLDEFKEETGITVLYEQLSNDQLNSRLAVAAAAGGKDIDAFMFQAYTSTKMYVNNGWLEPLDSYIDAEFDIADFATSGIKMASQDGVLYGIPCHSEYTNITYNKKYIEEAGIDVAAIKTWEDLIAACATVEEKLDGVHGIALRGQGNGAVALLAPLAWCYGASYLDADGNANINSPEWVTAVEKYAQLLNYAQEGASAMSWSETANVFAQGLCAFRMDSDLQYTYLIDESSSVLTADDLGFFALPAGTECAATSCGNWAIGISSGSTQKGAAWEFVRWVNTSENQAAYSRETGCGSPRASVASQDWYQAMFPAGFAEVNMQSAEIALGGILPDILYATEARATLGEALDEIFAGGDVQTWLDEANATMQELIDQERAENS